jgi:hypothetical protein
MAFDIFVSPAVFTKEIDLTFVPQGAASIVGTVIGLTQRGPAFTPVRCQGYSDFQAKFGGTNPNLYAPYAAKSYLRNASSVYMVRILGKTDVTLGKSVEIAFPASGSTSGIASVAASTSSGNLVFGILRSRVSNPTTFSYSGNYLNCVLYDGTNTVTVSFDSTKENFIKKVLGTNSTTAFLGDALTNWYVDSVFDYATSITSGLGSITGTLTAANAIETTYHRVVPGGYSEAASPSIVSQNFGGSVYPLFKVHSLSDGTASNYDVKVSILNVQTTDSSGNPIKFPKFDLVVRAFNDTDRKPLIIESFTRLTLDPQDVNFIAKVIGDAYYEADLTQTPPEISEKGDYDNKSKYIRVELFKGYPAESRPSGFQGVSKGGSPKLIPALPLKLNQLDTNGDLNTQVFMGIDFTQTGIIDRLKPSVTEIYESASPYTKYADPGLLLFATTAETVAASASLSASYTLKNVSVSGTDYTTGLIQFTLPLYGGWNGYTPEQPEKNLQADGSLTSCYMDAANIMSNAREFDTNLIVTPGINSSTPGNIVDRILQVIESRNDCFYILDIADTSTVDAGLDMTISASLDETDKYDSSYAATYYPWIKIFDTENNRDVWVPPSVEVFGAYSYNDRVGQPWSAPGGFTRAALNNVKSVRKRITQSQSDTLYNNKINPIVSFANEGIVIFGQKTLQDQTTALNRINVRRLLLEVRKVIASFSKYSIFEPNDTQTRQSLVSTIRPYLARVQQLRGIYDFRIVIDDTTTTPDLVDRNILYGKIYLQPTRTAEFISLDFILTNTGANFSEG